MNNKRVMRGVLWGLGGLLFFGLGTMLLWNWLMPHLFGLPTINILHAFGLLILGRLLFGGFGHGGPGHGWHPNKKLPGGGTGGDVAAAHMEMAAKWRGMSREDRRKVMEEMRGRSRDIHDYWRPADPHAPSPADQAGDTAESEAEK